MPGVPKSRACQACKLRRIKCDQNWPICTQCHRKKTKCSGPTSLLKFVHGGKHRTAQVEALDNSTPIRASSLGSAHNSEGRSYIWMPMRQTSSQPLSNFLPKSPTSLADQAASQLVGLLEWGQDDDTLLQYLKDVPRRLSGNQSLLDTVNFLCSVWSGYRSGKPMRGLLGTPIYGKALRSLRHTLQSEQALTVETLVSVYILERTEFFFSSGDERKSGIHSDAISRLVFLVGLPKRNDFLHSHIICDTYFNIVSYCMKSGLDVFVNSDPWAEMMAHTFGVYFEDGDLKKAIVENLFLPFRGYSKSPSIVQAFRSLLEDEKPNMSHAWLSAAIVNENWVQNEEDWNRHNIELRTRCLASGHMIERDDPYSIVGTSYIFSNSYLGKLIVASYAAQVYMLYSLYDRSDRRESYTELFRSRMRSLSTEIWKFIPYMRGVETCFCHYKLQTLLLTLEVADDAQAEYLLDVILELDSFQQNLPRDRDLLRQTVLARYISL